MSSKSLYIEQNLLAFTWPYPRLLSRMALHTPKNFSPSHTETRSNYIYSKILEVWEGWGLSRQNFAYLKCSVAGGKRKGKLFLEQTHISTFFLLHAVPFLKNLHVEWWFHWKKDITTIIVPNEHKILNFYFSSMVFNIPPYNAIYMIIYHLLFRRVRILYKTNDFNCLINKTWINV